MKDARIHCYTLDGSALKALIAHPPEGLAVEPMLAADVQAFTVLDSFDQTLRRSGRVLLRAGAELVLVGDTAGIMTQTAGADIRFITDLPNGPVKRGLKGLSRLRSLLPTGTGELQRCVWALVDDEGKTHCRIDMVRLKASKGRVAVVIALRGVRGYGDSLQTLLERVEDLGAAPLDGAVLSDRIFPLRSAYRAKPPIAIQPEEPAFDAASGIIRTCLDVARMNEFGIIADHDTEFLHDYRIQLRKIRSVLSLFKGVYADAQTIELKTRFSALMAATGALRDLDVYLLDQQSYYDLLPDSLHGGLDSLFALLARRRRAEQSRLARHLDSAEYKQEIDSLRVAFARPRHLKRGPNAATPALGYARALIWKRYRKVSGIAAAIDADTPDAEVHELRIQCKKLRYLMEFFAPMFPPAALRKVLKPLKGLQDNLGLFNDYSVQQESLGALVPQLSGGRDKAGLEVVRSLGALTAVMHHGQLEERAKVMVNLARFNSEGTRRLFRELFQQRESQI